MDNKLIAGAFKGKASRSFVSDKIKSALDKSIEVEFDAYNSYKAMHSWAAFNSYFGVAEFLKHQYEGELTHKDKVYEYMIDRNCLPNPPKVTTIVNTFNGIKDLFMKVLDKEVNVENNYKSLYDISFKEKDFTTVEFCNWFLKEQVEEIAVIIDLIDRIDALGGDPTAIGLLDQELLEKYGG